jgi:Right handed beta helix region
MKGFVSAAAVSLSLVFGSGASGRAVDEICVGSGTGCVATLQAGIQAAGAGDVVRIERGTFAGGVTIAKSVRLVGAGAAATVIKGGGPVLTLAGGHTVSIESVTITGGVVQTDPAGQCGADVPKCGPGYLRATALGGGIEIAPAATPSVVTLRDSVVSGNRAEPSLTVPSVVARCPKGPCSFAQAGGGGIDNWGTLTLVHSTVSGNVAGGGVTAQADGGGILSEPGSKLTLENATVTGNRAFATPPNARFAAGGGIYMGPGGTLTVRQSSVTGNSANLTTGYPLSVADMNAHAGGINADDDGSVTIDHTTISENSVTVVGLSGQPVGFDPGMIVGNSPLLLRDSVVRGNSLTANVRTSAEGGTGGGLEADGPATIVNTKIIGNSVKVTSSSGLALAVAVVNTFDHGAKASTIVDSVISGNSVRALSRKGEATIQGVGIANNGALEMRNVQVTNNVGAATGPRGWVHGGGIFNGQVFRDLTPHLTLRNVTVSKNRVSASHGLPVQGGGLYTADFPAKRVRVKIAANSPDQCFGC